LYGTTGSEPLQKTDTGILLLPVFMVSARFGTF
jgi:hypothetical protein